VIDAPVRRGLGQHWLTSSATPHAAVLLIPRRAHVCRRLRQRAAAGLSARPRTDFAGIL